MKTALVTGSAGFVGRHMVAELQWRGWSLTGCDPRGWDGRDALALFRDETTVYDLVVHAAARSPHRTAIDTDPGMHLHNALLDAAMFDWAVRTGQRRVLYLSSCAVLDERPDAYGAVKLAGERLANLARAAGLPVTVARPYSGYGEDQAEDFPFRAIVERARRREDPFVVWGDGTQTRDFIHIDDMVGGALALVEAGVDGPVSLCTGVGTSMVDLARMAHAVVGYQPEFELRLDQHPGAAHRVGDPSRLHEYYVPRVSLEEGVKRALGGG